MQPFTTNQGQVIQGLLSTPQDISNVQLQWLRNQYAPNDYMQGILAPYEHQAFAREVAGEGLGGTAAAYGGPIAYYLAKLSGLMGGRTPASMDEVFAGWQGANQGIRNPFTGQ